ncbi:DUF92 domain-containing protein [Arcticibacter sp.]|jgi:uncharacterized protein (TIGR00297 family)|uniref:DUF92 domain-containing protein n=1 Tax=Arcticibacter sp. TaxID=1872630 RepID=UPI00389021C9
MNAAHLLLIACLCAGMFFSVYQRKLTLWGSVCGGILAYMLYLGSGYAGVLMMAGFFVLGTGASQWRHQLKVRMGLAETDKGRRVASQVLANAGVPAIAALIAFSLPSQREFCTVLIASAFASATSDTLSSELGNVYGRRFYHVLHWQKDVRGENGVISLEGSMAGLAGSALIAFLFGCFAGFTPLVAIVMIAGMAGNLFDSVLGATLERKHVIDNDVVNFLNTLFAALVAGALLSASDFLG